MINELKTYGTNGKSSIQLLNIKPKPKRRIPPLQGKRSRVWKATKTEYFRQIRMSNQNNPVALDVHNKQWNHAHSSAENEIVRWEKQKHTELKGDLTGKSTMQPSSASPQLSFSSVFSSRQACSSRKPNISRKKKKQNIPLLEEIEYALLPL